MPLEHGRLGHLRALDVLAPLQDLRRRHLWMPLQQGDVRLV